VLGNLLKLEGFGFDTSEAVRDEVLAGVDVASKLNNALVGVEIHPVPMTEGLQRVSEVPIYATDAVVRRAPSLQQTQDAEKPKISMHSAELNKLGIQSGEMAVVSQGQSGVKLVTLADDRLPQGVARVPVGHPATAALGAMFGTITVERA